MISVSISFWMYMVLCDLQIWPEHWFIMHALQRRHELWVLDRGSGYFKFLKVHCWRIISIGEHIRCKPTSPCKLQSGPSDQYPRGEVQGVRGGICKSVITQSKSRRLIVKLPNLLCPLDVDPMAQIQVCTVCTKRLVCTWYIPYLQMCLL